jgi:NTE family protein
VALILQGGGALGAYQAGAYQALHEVGLEPEWVAGVSIGAINGAIIAGNPPGRRLEQLRAFWDTVTARPSLPILVDGDLPRRVHNAWSTWLGVLLGQPGFFAPNIPNPWLSFPGSRTATSIYKSEALRTTLSTLIDFKRLNSGEVRYAAGAVNVLTGNFQYFDSTETEILP